MSNQTRAQSYREQAKRLREKAKHFNTPEIRKDDMEAIARQYELMAEYGTIRKEEPRRRLTFKLAHYPARAKP